MSTPRPALFVARIVVLMRDGERSTMTINVVEMQPRADAMAIVATTEERSGPIRLDSDRIVELFDVETGEIVDSPSAWLRERYLVDIVKRTGGVPLTDFLDALPIAQLGPGTSSIFAAHYLTWGACLTAWRHIRSPDELPFTDRGLFEQIRAFMADAATVANYDAMATRVGVRPFDPSVATKRQLAGWSICFTGDLSIPRAEARRLAEAAGARVTTTPTRECTHVVAGPGAGRKIEQAREAGVTILDETAFRAALAGPTI